ncbi:MAG TPA: alpha/beta fold hydrolase [Cyclobacteriaceae bacterium]|nr:alpha/beta fold hydrolase [Cyclobacteriaceae bacterium]
MKLHFKKSGQGEPLIILHGLFGSADNWLSIAKGLENDYTLFLVDQRNHGDSGHSDQWDYQSMADDLKEFMEEQGIEKTHLLGHSMGGKTAMTFALQHPDKVNRLIVVDIAPRFYKVHHQSILDGLNAINMDELKSRKEADDILSQYEEEKGTRQFLLKSLGRNDEGKFIWKINLPIITARIENISQAIESHDSFDHPTLFIAGANSRYIQDKDKADIEKLFPNSNIIKIKNAGHWIHAEQPEAVIRTVQAFLG